MNKLLRNIRNRRDRIKSGTRYTYLLVIAWMSGFMLIFIIQAVLGIYSLHRISESTEENNEAVRISNSTQMSIQEQMISWQNILIRGSDPEEFNRNYHDFSVYAERVQNLLFNLKLIPGSENKVSESINTLIIMHNKLTRDFTTHIVDMKEKRFRNNSDKAAATAGMERTIIEKFRKTTDIICRQYGLKLQHTIRVFIAITIISFIIMVTLIVFHGREIGRRLVKTNLILEEKVGERTAELHNSNLSLQKEIEEHKITEEKLIEAKNDAEKKSMELEASEKRYRMLVEGTKDVIFILDHDWNFIQANTSVKSELKISPDAVLNYRFTDLIHEGLSDSLPSRQILTRQMEESKQNRTPFSFSACIKTPNLIEPVEMRVNLEYVDNNGTMEIIGKAFRNVPEQISEAFVSEKCEYSIGNQLFTAEDIVNRVTQNLVRYAQVEGIAMIRMALREMIINAIEHGNLEISFEEKSSSMIDDTYFQLINERQQLEKYRNRRVTVEHMITSSRAVFKISDQGKGFNHKKMTAEAGDILNENMLLHGRGIRLVRTIFDEVRYNARGNQVLLVKFFG